ncbi:hypothetical protein [Acidithrix sp. C25]|uniref:hypothetical protein n=1 Tax=Acidithrix sp. C25 TaxID=1671482 RepID=UPI00191B9449|nr:hypothetical protein [Acidithrix sp. C25]CAG4932334.1 unnamed protein product [Acidithrix sp. C25]
MTVSNIRLEKLADEIRLGFLETVDLPNFSKPYSIALEIHDHDDHAVVYLNLGNGGPTALSDGPPTLTLKAAADIAIAIRNGTLQVADAIAAGEIKISGSVSEVNTLASELTSKSEK